MTNNTYAGRLGTMLDCSRNAVPTLAAVKRWIDLTGKMGYNTLFLYMEDTYTIEEEPYFGHLRGRYSMAELREIDDYAFARGMEVIPCIQTLAHLDTMFHWNVYGPIHDCTGILLTGDDRTYALIDRMFKSLSSCFRSGVVNVGMDEAHMIGRGRYLDLHGLVDRFDILLDHLCHVSDIAKKYGKELVMWGDMFMRISNWGEHPIPDDVKRRIPDNLNLVYWDYYSDDKAHFDEWLGKYSAIKDGVWYAGGLWTWLGMASHNDYSIRHARAAMASCREHGTNNIFMTLWGDDGGELSPFAALPSVYCTAAFARGITDMNEIRRGFYEIVGADFDDFMKLDYLGTPSECAEFPVNPDRYMLYSDCFMGQFDNRTNPGDGAKFASCVPALKKLENDPAWGYLFRLGAALADALAVKYELGVRTRAAYLSGDKEAVRALLPDYDALLVRLDELYDAHEARWMIDNKPHGFDVQDARLGGLSRRVRHCRERLADFADGKADRIPELEEPVLDYENKPELAGTPGIFNRWTLNITANPIFL